MYSFCFLLSFILFQIFGEANKFYWTFFKMGNRPIAPGAQKKAPASRSFRLLESFKCSIIWYFVFLNFRVFEEFCFDHLLCSGLTISLLRKASFSDYFLFDCKFTYHCNYLFIFLYYFFNLNLWKCLLAKIGCFIFLFGFRELHFLKYILDLYFGKY
jgi:hypothetical protein